MSAMIETATAGGMQDALDAHLRRLDALEATIAGLRTAHRGAMPFSPTAQVPHSHSVASAAASGEDGKVVSVKINDQWINPPCAFASDLINLVDPPPRTVPKDRVFFIDARPPNNRASKKHSENFLPIESWCHLVFNLETNARRGDGSTKGAKQRQKASSNAVVFVCEDGIASKCAAANCQRYHEGWEVKWAMTKDPAVANFFSSNLKYARFMQTTAAAAKKA